MKFAILVNEGPYQHQASDTAYHFAEAALRGGHEVLRIFFYHDGVNNATRLVTPPRDERNIATRWQALFETYGVDLVVCVAASQRRGILDEAEAQRHAKDGDNLARCFRIAGLGQLMEAAIAADRVLVFGD